MAAKKKPLTTLTLADAGIEADKVGLGNATSQVAEFAARPPSRPVRSSRTRVTVA